MNNKPFHKSSVFWNLQDSNSGLKTWIHLENKSTLSFDWTKYNLQSEHYERSILISIAKVETFFSNEEIEQQKDFVINSFSIKYGDGIIAVNNISRNNKIGYVTDIKKSRNHSIVLNIEWLFDIKNFYINRALYTRDLLHKLKYSDLFDVPNLEDYTGVEPSTDSPLKLISHKRQLDSENNYEDDIDEDDDSEVEIDQKAGEITVFYGTNRKMNDFEKDNPRILDFSKINLGLCKVSIPKGHIQGEIERPAKLWIIERKEKAEKHIILKDVFSLDKLNFLDTINEQLKLTKKSALVFVHGYNTTFSEAAMRTAQIAWDIPFDGIAGFFSWPSQGKTLDYLKDIEYADATIPAFVEFVEMLLEKTDIDSLHVIGHSMGNRIVTMALNELNHKLSKADKLKKIEQVILAAPDLDRAVFENSILPKFKTAGKRRTLYTSNKDKALNVSRILRGGLIRLGDCGEDIFVSKHLDTVDSSTVEDKGNNHSYVFENKSLLTDLYYLLNFGNSSNQRRLTKQIKNNIPYWTFPL